MPSRGSTGGPKGGQRGDWRANQFLFQDNSESGSRCLPAWTLETLSSDALRAYLPVRVVRIRVRNFPIRKPERDIRQFDYDPAADDHKPSDPGQPMFVPALSTSQAPQRKTKFDVDATPFLSGSGKQRVLVKVVLAAGLEFISGFEITAKTKDSASRLVNLKILEQGGRPVARFWALSQNGGGPVSEHGFNIGVVALDLDPDSIFSLPLIIDPSVRVRG